MAVDQVDPDQAFQQEDLPETVLASETDHEWKLKCACLFVCLQHGLYNSLIQYALKAVEEQ